MADVFLSYAREDRARAEQVATGLEGAGIEVFWDNEIPPGATWADHIEQKLTQCKALIVLWSEHSTKSQWVREEARMGRDKGVLIPVMIDNSTPPFGFGELQAANLSSWNGEPDNPNWRRFVDAVGNFAKAAPRPSPQPAMSAPPRDHAPRPAAAPTPAEKKGLPVWVWVTGAVVATIVVLGIIGSMMPTGQQPVVANNPQGVQPVANPQQPVGDQNWQQTLSTQLQQASGILGQQGYQLIGQPYSASMSPGQSHDLPTDMNVGYEYQIVGVCDADCGDLDIRLYGGDGTLIIEDTSTNNRPNVGVIPTTSGTFNIQVHMYACNVAPCFYAVQLYARPLQ